jgi:hypothetical protein
MWNYEREICWPCSCDRNNLCLSQIFIDELFTDFKLSLKQIRGQGYDGARNMQGEFNELQSLIMRENSSAYYVYCFAHQLQLVLVAIIKGSVIFIL